MPGVLWTDDELRAALEAYLFVQRIEQPGLVLSEERLIALLQEAALQARNNSSIRYRMRNISAVLRHRGMPFLAAYTPADKVGTGVQARIEAMLDEMGQSAIQPHRADPNKDASLGAARAKARKALSDLADALAAFDEATPGIGHNNPPEPMGSGSPADDLRKAIKVVEDLRREIASSNPNAETVRNNTEDLAGFGVRRASWLRERAAKGVEKAVERGASEILVGAGVLLGSAVLALIQLLGHLL